MKPRSERDKRYEEKHKNERKAKKRGMGNEYTERNGGRNRRISEETRLYES